MEYSGEKSFKESLKEELDKFYTLYSQLNRAKNQKERNGLNKELDWLKIKMIKDFDLMSYDKHINHYKYDDNYFKNDVEGIISKLED